MSYDCREEYLAEAVIERQHALDDTPEPTNGRNLVFWFRLADGRTVYVAGWFDAEERCFVPRHIEDCRGRDLWEEVDHAEWRRIEKHALEIVDL
jgi:hypothetical protein